MQVAPRKSRAGVAGWGAGLGCRKVGHGTTGAAGRGAVGRRTISCSEGSKKEWMETMTFGRFKITLHSPK